MTLLPIWFGDTAFAHNGESATLVIRKRRPRLHVMGDNIVIRADIGLAAVTVWTCDLTKEYVAINGDYRS